MAELKDRLGVISIIVKKSPNISKTAIMKNIYLLEEIFDVPLDYSYRIYTYGPYCSQVSEDINIALCNDYISAKEKVFENYWGHVFSEGSLIDKADFSFANKYIKETDIILSQFANKAVPQLELSATIVYLFYLYKKNGFKNVDDRIKQNVKEIKPHFTEGQISEEYDNLLALSFLK